VGGEAVLSVTAHIVVDDVEVPGKKLGLNKAIGGSPWPVPIADLVLPKGLALALRGMGPQSSRADSSPTLWNSKPSVNGMDWSGPLEPNPMSTRYVFSPISCGIPIDYRL